MDTFTEMVNAVVKQKDAFTVGTIFSVDEAEMTCVVTPEDGGQNIEDVPLRIMRYADAVGFSIVPVVGTEVIVAWLDKLRPVIFRIHEWDKIVIQNAEGHGAIVKAGEVLLGVEASATHPVAWGDAIASHLAAFKAAYDAHTHGGMVPVPGPSPTPPNISSAEVKVS